MQKVKRNGEWRIELLKSERAAIDKACDVLCDLVECDADVAAVCGTLQGVLSRISEDGLYTEKEAVPDAEKTDAK